ncbi:MAG: 6,7-dimethyl-8-ribityllumazine synthase [Burkholderiaceae bacterium]|nr:6,7-dimethyl-8-ribityllumazine synthase [Burkholderiaceae bacterium]
MNEMKVDLAGEGLRIAIVQARFNESVGMLQREACVRELGSLGVDGADILVVTVPGALEIPLTLSQLAETGHFDALIALGAVIRGETYHFEVVSNESAAGISRVALEFHIPIANGVLTTENDAQAMARAEEKGRDCARVAVEMANLLFSIDDQSSGDDD